MLVCSLGGGCFEASIMIVEDGIFEVIGQSGDNYLGGDELITEMGLFFLSNIYKKLELIIHRIKDLCKA